MKILLVVWYMSHYGIVNVATIEHESLEECRMLRMTLKGAIPKWNSTCTISMST